jgi:hypothetical protein
MSITRFENLEVWQEAASLAVEVYAVSKNSNFAQDFGFRDQLRRSAVSIASNIAEGKERETIPEFIRYLYISQKDHLGNLRLSCSLPSGWATSPQTVRKISGKPRRRSALSSGP